MEILSKGNNCLIRSIYSNGLIYIYLPAFEDDTMSGLQQENCPFFWICDHQSQHQPVEQLPFMVYFFRLANRYLPAYVEDTMSEEEKPFL